MNSASTFSFYCQADLIYKMSAAESFAFGSMISAVDPVATLAIFQALNVCFYFVYVWKCCYTSDIGTKNFLVVLSKFKKKFKWTFIRKCNMSKKTY